MMEPSMMRTIIHHRSPLILNANGFLSPTDFGGGKRCPNAALHADCDSIMGLSWERKGRRTAVQNVGRRGWTRTSDPQLRRLMLYPPELRARVMSILTRPDIGYTTRHALAIET